MTKPLPTCTAIRKAGHVCGCTESDLLHALPGSSEYARLTDAQKDLLREFDTHAFVSESETSAAMNHERCAFRRYAEPPCGLSRGSNVHTAMWKDHDFVAPKVATDTVEASGAAPGTAEVIARLQLALRRTVAKSADVRLLHHLDHRWIGAALPVIVALCERGVRYDRLRGVVG